MQPLVGLGCCSSGGCGSSGVQLAKALGAREIVGVASGKNAQMVLAQGADRVIDYQTQRVEDEPADYDVVYDTATASGAGEDYRASGRARLAPARAPRRHLHPRSWLRRCGTGWEQAAWPRHLQSR